MIPSPPDDKHYNESMFGQNITETMNETLACFDDKGKRLYVNNTLDCPVVPFNTTISYMCQPDTRIQNETATKEEADDGTTITCSANGTFLVAADWPPVCVNHTVCEAPPERDDMLVVNTTMFEESWGENSYNSSVTYTCINGSLFDVDGDEVGETQFITLECLWSKTWSPWADNDTMPACVVTHCIFDQQPNMTIPEESHLQEVNSSWTPIRELKIFECKDKRSDNETHTRFLEEDRNLSNFSLYCLENGTFAFLNGTDSWPKCLEGI